MPVLKDLDMVLRNPPFIWPGHRNASSAYNSRVNNRNSST